MDAYLSLEDAVSETVVLKSRFICFIYQIKDESDAAAKLASLKKKYYDSTHVCYAYALKADNLSRSGDDGEPAGTAGLPILEVLKGGGYFNVLAAVVRYFGGTKLGAGGLARAYSDSVKKGVAAAKVIKYEKADIYSLSLDYADFNNNLEKFKAGGCAVLESSFGDMVSLKIAVTDTDYFMGLISNITKGKSLPEFIETAFILIN